MSKEFIAKRVARELSDGDFVNLGIGLPELVADYVPEDIDVTFQTENGIIGMNQLIFSGIYGTGERLIEDPIDLNVVNSGCKFATMIKGGSFIDSETSFMLIRGGHIDVTVLGALQVDETGTLANHKVPGKMVPGMGGAMDLVSGAKKVIIATAHTQKGTPKLVKKVTLPVTAIHCVDRIVTDLCVIDVVPEGFLLREILPDLSIDDLQRVTGAKLLVSDDLQALTV